MSHPTKGEPKVLSVPGGGLIIHVLKADLVNMRYQTDRQLVGEPLGNAHGNGRIVMLFLKTATYPLELLCDAKRLAEEAAKYRCPDDQKTTTPEERTFARGAIFTAFNFVESLLVELTQECIGGGGVDSEVQREIEDALRNGNAGVSKTIKVWPKKLGKKEVHGCSEFRQFESLRQLRNKLIHPKLKPLQPNDLTQDQLLQEANAEKAAWAVGEVKKMAQRLYTNFGVNMPPEVQ